MAGRRQRGGSAGANRRHTPLWAILCVWFGAALTIFSGATIAGAQALFHRYDSQITHKNLLGDARKPVEKGRNEITGPLNFLLLGSDFRENTEGTWRSDTVIVLHIPADHTSAYLISLPRDARVRIPTCPYDKSGCLDKVNAAYAYGGPQLAARTVSELTKLKFDGMAIINFYGFTRVVGALGGVDLCVDEDTYSIHTEKLYKKGCYHFNEHDALDYVRQREEIPDGDYGRQRHQQQLIRAALQQARDLGVISNPLTLDRVIRAAGQSLTVDLPAGMTVADLAFELRNVHAADMTMLRLPAHTEYIGGQSFEILEPGATELFGAVRTDTIDQWMLRYPKMNNSR